MRLAGDEYVWADLPAYSGNDSGFEWEGVDWEGVVNTGLKTYADVEKARYAADVAKAQAQYSYRYPQTQGGAIRSANGTLTLPGVGVPRSAAQSNDTLYMLAAVGIVGAAWLLAMKKRAELLTGTLRRQSGTAEFLRRSGGVGDGQSVAAQTGCRLSQLCRMA